MNRRGLIGGALAAAVPAVALAGVPSKWGVDFDVLSDGMRVKPNRYPWYLKEMPEMPPLEWLPARSVISAEGQDYTWVRISEWFGWEPKDYVLVSSDGPIRIKENYGPRWSAKERTMVVQCFGAVRGKAIPVAEYIARENPHDFHITKGLNTQIPKIKVMEAVFDGTLTVVALFPSQNFSVFSASALDMKLV